MARTKRALASLLSAGLLAIGLIAVAPSTAGAYGGGPANWQLTLAQTVVSPGTQQGFGIWGWCDLSGAADRSNPTSGTSGDCQIAIYAHAPSSAGGNLKCSESINITSWGEAPGMGLVFGVPEDLYLTSGTQTITPGSDPALCGPSGPTRPTDLDPAKPGHYNGNFLVALSG